MRIILLSIVVSLTPGCSGLVDTIRKNQQKQQIYKQYASKYYASCQKEAFSYYPVAIVTQAKTRKNLIEPTKTATCNRIGNTVNCRDTTIDLSGLSGAGKTTTSSYDANAGSRNNHIKNCIDNNLRNDSSYSGAVSRVNYSGGGNQYSSSKVNPEQYSFSEFDVGIERSKNNSNENKSIYYLNGHEKAGSIFRCFYGSKKQYSKDTTALPCKTQEHF